MSETWLTAVQRLSLQVRADGLYESFRPGDWQRVIAPSKLYLVLYARGALAAGAIDPSLGGAFDVVSAVRPGASPIAPPAEGRSLSRLAPADRQPRPSGLRALRPDMVAHAEGQVVSETPPRQTSPEAGGAASDSTTRSTRRRAAPVGILERAMAPLIAELGARLADRQCTLDLAHGRGEAGAAALQQADGFLVNVPGAGRMYAVKPEALRRWVPGHVPLRHFVLAVNARGWLVPGADSMATRQVVIGALGRQRYYCFKLEAAGHRGMTGLAPPRPVPAQGLGEEVGRDRPSPKPRAPLDWP
jgi:hypothetical protein